MIIPVTSKPRTSKANKTGTWRSGKKPHFIQKECIACRLCVMVCPEGCISGDKKCTYISDYKYCKGCGNCAAVCPVADIEMVKEEWWRETIS